MPCLRGEECEGVRYSALVDVMEESSAILSLCQPQNDASGSVNTGASLSDERPQK